MLLDRRGARRRRRRLPAEVLRAVRAAQGARARRSCFVTHDMARRRALLRPRDADRARPASLHDRRARTRSRAPTTSSTSAASSHDEPATTAATATSARPRSRTPGSRTRAASASPTLAAGRAARRCAWRSRFHERDRGPDLRRSTCATSRATRCSPRRPDWRDGTTGRFAAGDDGARARRASTTGSAPSRYTLTPSVARAGAGADALDLREDLAALVVHGTRVTGGDRRRRRTTFEVERAMSARQLTPRPRPVALGERPRAASGSLTWTLAVTDFKLRFYGSVLGYVWTLVRPFAFFGVIYFVFTEIVDARRRRQELRRLHPVRARAVPVLRRDRPTAALSSLVDAREPAAQDALPAAGDPALGRAHGAVQPRHDADRRVHLRDRVGVYPDWGWLELSRSSCC